MKTDGKQKNKKESSIPETWTRPGKVPPIFKMVRKGGGWAVKRWKGRGLSSREAREKARAAVANGKCRAN
ncbi:hypothetical protein Csa_006945, partial [Cucumis sativus]